MKPQEFQFRLMQAMQAGNWRRRPARAQITRILVVEDNEDDAVLIGETMAGRNDFVVLAAVGDGEEALAFLRREGKYEAAEKPDLVLLVAEDDPNDLAFLQEVLASFPIPCVVHDVPDGESALSFLRHRGAYQAAPRPDIVLLDVRMPGRDGFEVLREIRCDPALAGIRTVILTGFAPKGWIEEDWADRADAYLHKPVETAPLLETIRLLLEGAVS